MNVNIVTTMLLVLALIVLQAGKGRLDDWVTGFLLIILFFYGTLLPEAASRMSMVKKISVFIMIYCASLAPVLPGSRAAGISLAVLLFLAGNYFARKSVRNGAARGEQEKRTVPIKASRFAAAVIVIFPGWLTLTSSLLYYHHGGEDADLAVYASMLVAGITYFIAERVLRGPQNHAFTSKE